MELPAIEDEHHASGDKHEEPRMDKPGQRRHAEIVSAQAEVELVGRHGDDPCSPIGESSALLIADVALPTIGAEATSTAAKLYWRMHQLKVKNA